MQLVTFRSPTHALGVVVGGRAVPVVELGDATLPTTMDEAVHGGSASLNRLRSAVAAMGDEFAARGVALGGAELLAPVPTTRQIVAVGRNYLDHTSEQGAVAPATPLLFSKLASSISAPGADICWDPAITQQVDYEAELGVVIGSTTHRVSEAEALAHVFGYCCVNDVSARDLQRSDGQWVRSKSLDTFCPFGPVLVTADEVPDPQALDISCTVNGEVRQSASTAEMFFSVAQIIAYCSTTMTLQPGDLITTGTPGGVGMFRDPPGLLADGDEVVVEIAGLGRLVNRCRTIA